MTDPENMSARERLAAIAEADRAEAIAATQPAWARWITLRCARLMRWCAQDHRDYDRDVY